jgi:hypothetical protein
MPDAQETLSSFAEISVALVGFSGIVIAFGRRSMGALTRLEQRRLANLFLFGGGVMLLALTGIALLHTSLDQVMVWRFSSAVLVVLGAPWALVDARRIRSLDAADRVEVSGYVLYPFVVTGTAILLLQIANVFLIREAWPFFLGLVFGVAFALQQFVLLVRSGIGGGR